MNLPNKLTIGRIITAIIILIMLMIPWDSLGIVFPTFHVAGKVIVDLKYVIAGIVGMLLYQQIQNIGMTLGLLPIMGIPLPYISYGGSSIITYTIFIAFIINTNRKKSHTLSKQLK